MNILVIDGQGGRMGAAVIEQLVRHLPGHRITAVGTNSVATAAMLKAGAPQGATGENPVAVACRTAHIIIGPIGIVAADALLGEVTPAMAVAVGQSAAHRILLPVNRCNTTVVGVEELTLTEYVRRALVEVGRIAATGDSFPAV